jgi:hypothetical protein
MKKRKEDKIRKKMRERERTLMKNFDILDRDFNMLH